MSVSERMIALMSAEAVRGQNGITAQLKPHEVESLRELDNGRTAAPNSRTVHAIDLFDLTLDQLPKVGWLITGEVQRLGLWLLSGLPKRGKSLLRRLAAVCIALGKPLFGHEVQQGKVLMLIDEDELADEWQCIAAIAETLGSSADELRGKIFVVPPQGVQVDNRLDMEAIRVLISEIDPIVVFIDPLIRYHRQDENKADEMQAVLRPLAVLGRERCIAVVHHTDKEGREPRGTSDLLASYKTLWRVTANAGDVKKIGISAILKSGPTPEPLTIGFVFKEDGSIEIVGHEAADKLNTVKAKVLKALKQKAFLNRSALADHIRGNRKNAFEAINRLIAEGRIEESADAKLSAEPAVPSSAPKESGTLGTTTAKPVSEPMENQPEPQEPTAFSVGAGVSEESKPGGSDPEELNDLTRICQDGTIGSVKVNDKFPKRDEVTPVGRKTLNT